MIHRFLLKALRIWIIICTMYALSSKSYAQVTIGSDNLPNTGALLDLKQYTPDADNTTAKKGLGMPRVNLTDVKKLIDIADATGKEAEHIGLVVYNVNKCLKDAYGRGIYVWNGGTWVFLGSIDSQLYTYTDQEGKPFRAAHFGNAGIWMTQNLAVTSYDTDSGVASDFMDSASPQIIADNTKGQWCYPSENRTDGQGKLDDEFKKEPEIGLLYNWAAATGGKNTLAVDQAQVEGPNAGTNEIESAFETPSGSGNKNGKIQGICPNGWHIPSDREWNELEKELATDPGKYSDFTATELTMFDPQGWNTNWEWGASSMLFGYRGSTINQSVSGNGTSAGDPGIYGHGAVMKSTCQPPSTVTADIPYGRGELPLKGGFEALLIGYAAPEGVAYENITGSNQFTQSYSRYTMFWTSSRSSNNGSQAIHRALFSYRANVFRSAIQKEVYYSVRCKKDVNTP